jgi:hypothetical protein
MGDTASSILAVTIDFDQSHLFFPRIIMCLLLLLLAIIAVLYGRKFFQDIRAGRRHVRFFQENYDKIRLFGTIIGVVIYFVLMDYVGTLFPNTGLGFLLVSIPFMLFLSLLYVHDLDRKKTIIILLNSTIAPLTAWYILGNLFNITLP